VASAVLAPQASPLTDHIRVFSRVFSAAVCRLASFIGPCYPFTMQRHASTLTELRHSLFHAVLMAALIFQAVIGAAHLAIAATAQDGQPTRATCLAATPTGWGDPPDRPDDGDTPGKPTCAACASNHQSAGDGLPQLAAVSGPAPEARRQRIACRDQWPNGRQPRYVNSRAPPAA